MIAIGMLAGAIGSGIAASRFLDVLDRPLARAQPGQMRRWLRCRTRSLPKATSLAGALPSPHPIPAVRRLLVAVGSLPYGSGRYVPFMEYTQILYGVDDGVATITLHRPERMNAFTGTMMHEMIDAFDQTDADDDVRAVIVTGCGAGVLRRRRSRRWR